ncbi:putative LysR-family transcriptional regulator [Actinoplanes missouriensis 431]|uniref:Putative LysR-family transcriptional regulator n=1 Tax=Actinoplanes missouriensis (strain ATCC 14538 / DSM 43046 / CBS 188.64 / JCM 3121 / NBRC 102363 / NCIMB 12654 / NRRL B-3342 / UNCC 431) TaxID=512565 RepID=I0H6V0_ACTM4|nr:LysR substrate-binding domain-containing protein [Actinoplanes missouriensis]BAL88737.1 putative LysR-family transcriptional regulator [Actinoplanes missouriensis 431]
MLDLHRLRLLRELAHRGTLTAVAQALSYSPSTVSQQLSQLEAEAGAVLLEHVGRRVRLTPQAHILVACAEQVLEQLEQAQADVAALAAEVAGVVRVAAFQTAALTLLPAAITTLAGRHPRLRVHLIQAEPEQALPALLAREFDLVIAEEYPEQPQPRAAHAESEELLADPIRLVHPRAVHTPRNRSALTLLAGHPWVMEPVGSASRAWAAAVCRTAGFEPEVRYETSDLILQRRLVEAGHAAAFLPDLIWNGRRPTVPTRPLPTTQARRRVVTTVRRGHAGHPIIVALRAALAEAA